MYVISCKCVPDTMWEFTVGVNVLCLYFVRFPSYSKSRTTGIVNLIAKNCMSLFCLVAEICKF